MSKAENPQKTPESTDIFQSSQVLQFLVKVLWGEVGLIQIFSRDGELADLMYTGILLNEKINCFKWLERMQCVYVLLLIKDVSGIIGSYSWLLQLQK